MPAANQYWRIIARRAPVGAKNDRRNSGGMLRQKKTQEKEEKGGPRVVPKWSQSHQGHIPKMSFGCTQDVIKKIITM